MLGADDLWVKRDDLVGLGGGGNKVRKLEWTVGAALADGADTLITTGAPQSNHARLTCAAAARLGLGCVLVLAGAPGTSRSGNLALDGLLGARLVHAGDVGQDGLDAVAARTAAEFADRGARPAIVPFGGSSPWAPAGTRSAARS